MTDQQLDTMITDEHINKVYLFLPRWEEVAHHLGVDPLDIGDNKDIRVRKHEVLTTWKAAQYKAATYRKLIEVLESLKEVKSAAKVCDLMNNQN